MVCDVGSVAVEHAQFGEGLQSDFIPKVMQRGASGFFPVMPLPGMSDLAPVPAPVWLSHSQIATRKRITYCHLSFC